MSAWPPVIGAMIWGRRVGSYLVVGMDHDRDVGASPERLGVAGLLVRAVPVVAIVDEDVESQVACNLERVVRGAIVYEDDKAHLILGKLLVGEA
jgi:hypothetical protein